MKGDTVSFHTPPPFGHPLFQRQWAVHTPPSPLYLRGGVFIRQFKVDK